ncbi:MAG: DUF389 domain-containing protein [Bacteroidia bacterium]|nr:DUF389 domain-containing protein [Bacteroidia bacterium]
MSEELKDSTEEVKKSATGLFQSLRNLIKEIFDVHDEIDKEGTAKSIKKDVVFKGFNIWILILSILICSIGLNLNSTAVIIGAMLISPLMGPITGVGFAIGTFDRDLLLLALKHLAIATVISVLASYAFFSFAPIGFDHSELDSRTAPGILDLLVALFGGFAGILAGSRGSKTNVIPGVAIATALMPPLCTAGYGLAVWDMNYFLGAIYLFFINSVFISLAALIVVRYLRFPIASYINPKLRRRGRGLIILFVIAVAVPSVIIYGKALRESIFKTNARNFISECISDDGHSVISPQFIYTDSVSTIRLFVYGSEYTKVEKDSITGLLAEHGLENTRLEIHNMGTSEAFRSLAQQKDAIIGETENIKNQLGVELSIKNDENKRLSQKIERIGKTGKEFDVLVKEASVLFEDIESIDYSIKPLDDSLKQFVTVVFVDWKSGLRRGVKTKQHDKLSEWVDFKFTKTDSVRLVEIE